MLGIYREKFVVKVLFYICFKLFPRSSYVNATEYDTENTVTGWKLWLINLKYIFGKWEIYK